MTNDSKKFFGIGRFSYPWCSAINARKEDTNKNDNDHKNKKYIRNLD